MTLLISVKKTCKLKAGDLAELRLFMSKVIISIVVVSKNQNYDTKKFYKIDADRKIFVGRVFKHL